MSQSFRLAIKSIASSKMRSFLTMLGIIIGVASVIILVSLMQGMTNYISDSFSDLGTDQVSVSVTNTDTRNVDVDTMYAFLDEQSELFANMSPTVSVRATLKKGTESTTTTSITGVGEGLKAHNPDVKIVAVEPTDSPVISQGKAGPHKIQGIGAGFVPDILNTDILDEIVTVSNEAAFTTTKTLAKTEGLLVGISAGAAVYAATQLAKRPENK
ncbi:pyridoxal-phosphate dependent enzyme, partial [Blautia wexlerae]|nr:pyridoxal-phosphate dependent enzyme [Blautia wexlerae]